MGIKTSRMCHRHASPKHACWSYVYFIQEYQSPFLRCNKFHHLFSSSRTLAAECYHVICGDDNNSIALANTYRILIASSELYNVPLIECRPCQELIAPLIH